MLVTGGAAGLRCGVLTGCLTGTFAALTELGPLEPVREPDRPDPSTRAAPESVISSLRARRSPPAPPSRPSRRTWPARPPPPTPPTATVFVEQVGSGDGTCSLVLPTGVRAGALVVARGRVAVSGSGTFQGVLTALNGQRATLGDDAREVVRISGYARVAGAVFADELGGATGLCPPPLDPYLLIDQLPLRAGLLAIRCAPSKATLRALGATQLVNGLVSGPA